MAANLSGVPVVIALSRLSLPLLQCSAVQCLRRTYAILLILTAGSHPRPSRPAAPPGSLRKPTLLRTLSLTILCPFRRLSGTGLVWFASSRAPLSVSSRQSHLSFFLPFASSTNPQFHVTCIPSIKPICTNLPYHSAHCHCRSKDSTMSVSCLTLVS